MSTWLVGSLATTDDLAAVFSDEAMLAAMLAFEAALARAEGHLGIIPAEAARTIADFAVPASFEAAAIGRAARESGTAAIPLVQALTARVEAGSAASAPYVHWGATSQDVTDTALALCLGRALPLLAADHDGLCAALRRLSDAHAGTVMLARTLMQPAAPTTFGLKAAGWLAGCARTWPPLVAAFEQSHVVQLGGAAGTLAAFGDQGEAVVTAVARELGLGVPDAPWHSHRDRLTALVLAAGLYTAAIAKIARDVTLLMQHEVAEASEPGGGSSSMPHKRNPARCAIALAAATRLPGLVSSALAGAVHEHERGVGGWHAEAPTVVAAVQATGAAVAAMRQVIDHLSVDPDRMRANLDATGGAVFAGRAMAMLAPRLGRAEADRLVAAALEAARRYNRPFAATLADLPGASDALSPAEWSRLDTLDEDVGAAEVLRRRLLATPGA